MFFKLMCFLGVLFNLKQYLNIIKIIENNNNAVENTKNCILRLCYSRCFNFFHDTCRTPNGTKLICNREVMRSRKMILDRLALY